MPVNSRGDCQILQKELNTINNYFDVNCLRLNEKKTKFIIFHKCHSPLNYEYMINSVQIERVVVIKDLGVLLDEKLNFKNHINYIISKAKSTLAWIKRFSYEFEDPWVIKRIFETFVLPILEYASQIWAPKFKNTTVKIESIQKQFLLFALRKFHWHDRFHLPSYKHRLLFFHMNTLEDRRLIYHTIFIISLIHGKISSPLLLNELKIRVPQRFTRNYLLLDEAINVNNSPFATVKRNFNEIFAIKTDEGTFIFDLNKSIDAIKRKFKQYFEQAHVNT